MDIKQYHKKDIAANQLETALGLFFADRELFSVITLAAAAEEIMGDLLRQRTPRKGEPLFRSILALLGLKKTQPQQEGGAHETELYLHMDLRQEALFLLGRAIDDYHALTGGMTRNMQRFKDEVRGAKG